MEGNYPIQKKTCDYENFPIEMILYKYFLNNQDFEILLHCHQIAIKLMDYNALPNVRILWQLRNMFQTHP